MAEQEKKKFATLTHEGRGYTVPLMGLGHVLGGEMESAEVGDQWTIKVVEMTQEQYEKLPEFEGF